MRITIKKITNIIIDIILVCLVIIAVLIVYAKVLYSSNPDKVPMPLGINVLTVLTGSMQPYLMPADKIFIKKADSNKLSNGDIITFYSSEGNMVITHRITDIIVVDGKRAFITKGDYNNINDLKPVYSDQIIGKLVFRVAPLNFVTRSIQNGSWPYYLLGLTVATLIIGIIYLFLKNKR